MTDHRVNSVDAIWLNTDRVQNLMVIECVMFLASPLDRPRFDRLLQERLIDVYPAFSRRPCVASRRWGRVRWRDVPDLDLTKHVHEVTLPAPGDAAALQRYIGRFLAQPLSNDRPLWEIHLVGGLDEGAAIYVRLHHALADGIVLTHVLLSLTDSAPELESENGHDSDDRRTVAGDGGALAGATRGLLGGKTRSVAALRIGLGAVGVLGKLVRTRNPRSALVGSAGTHKLAVWSDPIDLQLIKDIARTADATVNDVLVSTLAGALLRYQVERGLTPVDMPTMIPVNLRPAHVPLPRELGNRFAVVLLTLPSSWKDASARLAETKRRMDRIKRSPEPVVTFALIRAIGMLGRRLSSAVITYFAGKASGVTTNVPGPREARYLAGTRITGLLGWVPGSADQTLGTCIFTYAGTVTIGFKTDGAVIGDPGRILAAFGAELDDLARATAR